MKTHGLTVNRIARSGMIIDFSGTAGQVRAAFATELHHVNVNGVNHLANTVNPSMPAALRPAVEGIVSLNDFDPSSHAQPRSSRPVAGVSAASAPAGVTPNTDTGTGNPKVHAFAPDDIPTISNFTPPLHAGATGRGQTVAVAEPADLYSADDWNRFRNVFGLSKYKHGRLITSHPGNCSDPGLGPNNNPFYEYQVAVDSEWASAGAPDATIEVASCGKDEVGNGVVNAVLGLIDRDLPPSAISISYVRCESGIGPVLEATIRYAFQQAASEGISVFASGGDSGGSACDFDSQVAHSGFSVSAYASTPYNVAVGGTEFTDPFNGTSAQYYRPKNNAIYGSAKSYIPEAAYNESCGSTLIANRFGYAVSYGSNGFCNSAIGQGFAFGVASGGGASSCAFGEASSDPDAPAVSGTCRGYKKPNYQMGIFGNPADGARDLPDISMIAAGPDTSFLVCFSDSVNSFGSSCAGNPLTWLTAGGTGVTTPLLAGVQAMVDQHEKAPQGNPNYVYYSLARQEFGARGNAACSASLGPDVDPSCVFHDVTEGDNDIPCTGPLNCYDPSGTYGVLSKRRNALVKAWNAKLGWDFASGLGSFNVTNLINEWENAQPIP